MVKRFEELTEADIIKFAAFNDLPITSNKRDFVRREYEKAMTRGIITDESTKRRMRVERIPMIVQ